MKKILITLCFLISGALSAVNAQEAKPAALGIYIDLGKVIPKHSSYSISRKAADSTTWTALASLSFQPDSAVFFAALSGAGAKYPNFQMPDKRFFGNIWKVVLAAEITDSLFYYGSTPAFKEALGAAYYDRTAKPNVNYQYKITQTGNKGAIPLEEKTVSAKYPQEKVIDYQLVTRSIEPFKQSQVLKYYSNGIHQPAGITLMRSVYMQTAFEPLAVYTGITHQSDSVIYLGVDTLIKPRTVYQYVAIPFDELGNPGLPSDTVRVSTTTLNNTAFVDKVKTESLEKESAIKLSWKLNDTPHLTSINIYRSESYDGADYVEIATVAATDTVFLDKKVHPVKHYFYSLQPNTIFGPGALSVRFSGMLKANKKAAVPAEFKAEVENGKVKLSWKRPEFYTRGYYVYRRKSNTDSLKQISELIVTDSMQVTYYDTTEVAQNALSYSYAIKAVNTSYDISGFSEVISIATPGKVKLNTPLTVRIRVTDDQVMLFWDNKSDQNALGYYLFRRVYKDKGPEEFTQINNLPLHVSFNYYHDTAAVKGVVYEYAIQSVSTNGQLSVMSAPVKVGVLGKRLLPAGGLQVLAEDRSVILSWDVTEQEEVTGYKIYRLNADRKVLLASLEKGADFYEDKDPGTKQLNTYVITCISKDRESEESMPISIRLKQ
jgi:fibronectin type 3 domain-containing protein